MKIKISKIRQLIREALDSNLDVLKDVLLDRGIPPGKMDKPPKMLVWIAKSLRDSDPDVRNIAHHAMKSMSRHTLLMSRGPFDIAWYPMYAENIMTFLTALVIRVRQINSAEIESNKDIATAFELLLKYLALPPAELTLDKVRTKLLVPFNELSHDNGPSQLLDFCIHVALTICKPMTLNQLKLLRIESVMLDEKEYVSMITEHFCNVFADIAERLPEPVESSVKKV